MRGAIGTLLAVLALCGSAAAQGTDGEPYPSRPIRIVVPTSPGGEADFIARVLADRMGATLGQPVIVENVPGANGDIGTDRVARAEPDGYTLVLGMTHTHVINGTLHRPAYDVAKDFEPITLITESGRLIVARSTLPADDLRGLVAWLLANPGKASMAIAGMGSVDHIAGVMLQNATGVRLRFVPYRGTGPALQDLLEGRVDLMIAGVTETLRHIRAGSLKAYAVTAGARFPAAPEIPTADEAGVPGLHVSLWTSLWAPRNTPKGIVRRLNAAAAEALADPGVRSRFVEPVVIVPRKRQTPGALRRTQQATLERWWPSVRNTRLDAK